MLLSFLHYNITLVVVFTTLYSYGNYLLNLFKFNDNKNLFFKVLVGYTFVGIITVIVHFFFKINNVFSIILILIGLIVFIINHKTYLKRNYWFFLLLLVFMSPLLFANSSHPIDSNMYHHPYVSYLKSEKIVIAIANIQFRFGHISFLQYTQAALTNNYLHKISLASINIIFYFSFIYYILKDILLKKKIDYIFLVQILIGSFLLIKFARYREYGNDLIPLLVCLYFLIEILKELYKSTNYKIILINLALPFLAFMFAHKISYIFATFIFLVIVNYRNLSFFKIKNNYYILVSLLILFPWLLKNYFTTSCFAYPVAITCFSNNFFVLSGLAEVSNAAWLSEIWAKGFIDHPDWRNLDLNLYISKFNWVSTWMNNHFIKILEIMSPLFLIIILLSFGLIANKEFLKKNNSKIRMKKDYIILLFLIILGLFFWFYNAPLFRYGAFYIIAFIAILFISCLDYLFKIKKFENLNFFKIIFGLSVVFFILKNFDRINNSNNSFFPKTIMTSISIHPSSTDLIITTPKTGGVCHYTDKICSHEIPKNLYISKLRNYYILGF